MFSAVPHGDRKRPINVTHDLLLLGADLTQLDGDSGGERGGGVALVSGVPRSVPLTPGSSDYETQGGRSPLSPAHFPGAVCQFCSHTIVCRFTATACKWSKQIRDSCSCLQPKDGAIVLSEKCWDFNGLRDLASIY